MRILIDIDALIDTRVGLIRQHWPDKLSDFDFDSYSNRVRDDIHSRIGVSKEEWDEKWNNRDLDTFANSRYTVLYTNLPVVFGSAIFNSLSDPMGEAIEVIINTYPYQFSEEEVMCICEMVNSVFWRPIKINTISEPLENITSQALGNLEVTSYIVYDYIEWVKLNISNITTEPKPALRIYYPALYSFIDDEELDNLTRGKVNLFDQHAREFAIFYSAVALETKLMSIEYDISHYKDLLA